MIQPSTIVKVAVLVVRSTVPSRCHWPEAFVAFLRAANVFNHSTHATFAFRFSSVWTAARHCEYLSVRMSFCHRLCRSETLAEVTEWHEADAQFLERGQDALVGAVAHDPWGTVTVTVDVEVLPAASVHATKIV